MNEVVRYCFVTPLDGRNRMVEARNGDWVVYSAFARKCKQLDEAQRALAVCRVELQAIKKEMGVSLLSLGCCPECSRKVYNYTAPTSGNYEWIRQHGVDPTTNHKIGCSLGSM